MSPGVIDTIFPVTVLASNAFEVDGLACAVDIAVAGFPAACVGVDARWAKLKELTNAITSNANTILFIVTPFFVIIRALLFQKLLKAEFPD
jgi:hypothetical protein